MIPIPLPQRRFPLLSLLILSALLLAACSADDSPQADASQADSATSTPQSTLQVSPTSTDGSPGTVLPVRFQNDPALEALIDPDALDIPGRFLRIARDDREPILTLGLVDSAARLTYAVTVTAEVLSFDLLRLDPTIDPETFFLAFADTVVDTPGYSGVDNIGVPRGVGDRVRHITFTVDGDSGDAVVLLRDDILAFLTYRHPPNLRQPIDIAGLMRALDSALQNPPAVAG